MKRVIDSDYEHQLGCEARKMGLDQTGYALSLDASVRVRHLSAISDTTHLEEIVAEHTVTLRRGSVLHSICRYLRTLYILPGTKDDERTRSTWPNNHPDGTSYSTYILCAKLIMSCFAGRVHANRLNTTRRSRTTWRAHHRSIRNTHRYRSSTRAHPHFASNT